MKTAKDQLQQWFQYLQDFQVACEQVDTDVYYETLLTFANDKVTQVLSSTDEQNQFILAAQASTQLVITPSDLTASSSFEALLETTWNPLSIFVMAFIRSCTTGSFSSMSFTDFVQQKVAAVFPGSRTDPSWLQVLNGLSSSIPAVCYSSKQQSAVSTLLSTNGKTIQDLINLVSTLG